MKIVEPKYTILTSMDRHEILKHLEFAGRICYKSQAKEGSAANFVKNTIMSKNHQSVIEHFSVSVLFMIDRGCYDAETEVLTEQGWKFFKDVVFEDKIACLSDEGELFFDKQTDAPLNYWYEGDLLHFKSTMIDLNVTPDHRMWVFDYDKRSASTKIWKFLKASNLKNRRYKFEKTCNIWQGNTPIITIKKHPTKYNKFPERVFTYKETLSLFELLGLWITDGSYRCGHGVGGSQVIISQTKKEGVSRIKELCGLLGFHYLHYKNEIRIENERLKVLVESFFGKGAKTFTAKVPSVIKNSNSELISSFLQGVILGDGSIHKKNKHTVVYTSSKLFADDLQELFLKIGKSASIREIAPRKRVFPSGVVSDCKKSYVVSVAEKESSVHLLNKKVASSFGEKNKYRGYVYCLTVPGHRLYVRRKGKAVWCGNCSHELVRHRLASFSQSSTRYCNYSKDKFGNELTFILPCFLEKDTIKYQLWESAMLDAEEFYLGLLKEGASPQEARSVLPNSLMTEIVVTANLREWLHIFELRCSPVAHPQMREIMIPLRKTMQTILPEIFGEPV